MAFGSRLSPNAPTLAIAFLLNAPLLVGALLSCFLLLAVLIYGHRYLSTRFVYVAAQHLLVADALSMLAQFATFMPSVLLPAVIEQRMFLEDYVESGALKFVLACELLAHLATFHFVALQTVGGQLQTALMLQHNRAALLRLNASGQLICIGVWLWLAALLLHFGFSHCAMRFNTAYLCFYTACYSPLLDADGIGGRAAHTLIHIWLTILMIVAFVSALFGWNMFKRRIVPLHLVSQQQQHQQSASPSAAAAAARRFRQRCSSISVSMVFGEGGGGGSGRIPASPSINSQTALPWQFGHSRAATSAGRNKKLQTGDSAMDRRQQPPLDGAKMDRRLQAEILRAKSQLLQSWMLCVSLALRYIGYYLLPWVGAQLFGSGLNALNENALLCAIGNALIVASIVSHPLIYWLCNIRIRAYTDEVRVFMRMMLRQQGAGANESRNGSYA